MKTVGKLLAAAVLLVALVAPAFGAQTIRLAVTDLEGLEELQREFGEFQKVLNEKTGYEFEFYPVPSRTAGVEALASRKIDFVLTGPAEYVVFKKRTDAYPVIGFSRPDYFSGIIVLSDSGINTVEDLKGKKVAFGDVGSTSNHLAPMQVLADNGIDPRRDIEAMHVDKNVAWEALKRGDIAAIGMNMGKFSLQREKEKQLEPGAFKVIARGPDLPNDVLLVGTHVDKAVVEKVRQTFSDNSQELITTILIGQDNEKYKGMKFLPNIQDSDYNYVRSMYVTIGYPAYAQFVGD